MGGESAVVFLWQDGLRGLSLFVGQDDSATWVCAPGHSYGQACSLDVTDNLTRGTAVPSEFVRDVWLPWSRGETPSAEHIAGFTGALEPSQPAEEP